MPNLLNSIHYNHVAGTFIETMKAAMSLLTNINPGPPRVPQQPLSAEAVASMAKDLQSLGFSVNL